MGRVRDVSVRREALMATKRSAMCQRARINKGEVCDVVCAGLTTMDSCLLGFFFTPSQSVRTPLGDNNNNNNDDDDDDNNNENNNNNRFERCN